MAEGCTALQIPYWLSRLELTIQCLLARSPRSALAKKSRPQTPIPIQLSVFERDRWLCHVCRRPVVFHLALKYLEIEVKIALPDRQFTYWNSRWSRDQAPLADELAACIDHVAAYSRGGAHDLGNFATICNRCNARKSAKGLGEFVTELRPWKVRGKHGEPSSWDGLASTFVYLARKHRSLVTVNEEKWLAALQAIRSEWAPG
jgi:5-methylcytosine-specific restriction endonuclease McrA